MLNNNSRRKFIKNALVTGALLPLSNNKTIAGLVTNQPSKSLKILILGGTSFLGPHTIAYALERGHQVTTFTRGKTKPTIHPDLFDQVEMLIGDREDNLESLKGKTWDAVIDNSGRKTAWTKATAELLKDHIGMYLYTSSASVYYPYYSKNIKEDTKLVMEIPEIMEADEKPNYDYGVMKATSEKEAMDVFGPERTIVIRPTFMVGPGDRVDRFMYWPVKLPLGGDIIIPGKPEDNVQYVDVRDISEWMVRLFEQKVAGVYNGIGPASPMTVPAFVYGGHAAFSSKVNYVPIDDYSFLRENGIGFMAPWVMPEGKYLGMMSVLNNNSVKNGLTYRPLATTMYDTHQWWHSEAVTVERRSKFESGENSLLKRQAEVIKKWRDR